MSEARTLEALDALQAALDLLRASLTGAEPRRDSTLVSIKAAARALCLHERTVRRRAKAGAGVMIGGVWRVDVEAMKGPVLGSKHT